MVKAVFGRLATAVSALFGASILSFVLLRLAPGDPVGLILGPFATEDAKVRLADELGIHQPVFVQYWHYIMNLAQGNWGYSFSTGLSVFDLFLSRLPASLELSFFALVFALAFASLLALVKTYFVNGWIKKAVDAVCFIGYSVPQFWLGLLLLTAFSGTWGLFPGPEGRLSPGTDLPPGMTGFLTIDALWVGQFSTFADALWHLVLPSFTLGLFTMAFLARILQVNLEKAQQQLFVRMSMSRGLSRWGALIRHSWPNALVTSSTAAGVVAGIIITGSALVEKTFAWPGIGSLVTEGVQKQDFAVVQAFILVSAVVFVTVNLLVDLWATRIDPRLRRLSL